MPTKDTPPGLMLATLLAGVLGLAGCELAVSSLSAEQRESWSRDYTLEATGRIEVTNTNGAITVAPSPDGQVHVKAEKIAKGSSDEAAREALKAIEIVETTDGSTVRLQTRVPKGGLFGGNASVTYTMEVPPAVAVRVVNTNGKIELTGLAGLVEAETTNGGIEGRRLSGSVRAETTNGGVDLDLAAVGSSGVDVSTTNGGVEIILPGDAKADVSATCVNGSIRADDLALETTESSRRRLEGQLNGGGPRIRAETVNGGIRFAKRE